MSPKKRGVMKINAGVRNQQINHNLFNINNIRARVDKPWVEKIKTVAKVVFSILLSLVLFSVNPGIFFISFVAGVAFSKTVQQAVDKISIFMKHYKKSAVAGVVLSALLVLPFFIATGSAVWAAHMGSVLSQRAQRFQR